MILQMFEPGHGGVLTYVKGITTHLLDRGIATAVAYSSRRADQGLAPFLDLLKQSRTPVMDMRVGNLPGGSDLLAIPGIWKFCRAQRVALIHCHSTKAGILGRILAMLLGIPAVYTPHAYYGLNGGGKLIKTVANRLERWLGRVGKTMACGTAEYSFAVDRLQLNPQRVVINENGVDFEVYCPQPLQRRMALRTKLGLPTDRYVVLFIGRLQYQKDPLTVLRGFAQASADCPSMHLHFVGQGQLEDVVCAEIEKLRIADRITRTKYHGQPHELYQSADCYVSASRYEGMPLVVLEALASDLPLTLTDCPGHERFLGLPLNQLQTVDRESPSQIARGLLELYQRRNEPPNHREQSIGLFSKENSHNRTVTLYQQLMAKKDE